MSITIQTPAVKIELTTLQIVKAELGETESLNNGLIIGFIQQASSLIESHTNRTFRRETITEKIGSYGSQILILERTPIVSISEIKFNGTTIGSTTYVIEDAEAGFLYREIGWTNTRIWTSHITAIPTRHTRHDWEIDYTAGYILPGSTEGASTLPKDIERACIDLSKSWFLGKDENPNVKSERTGDASETRYDVSKSFGMPPAITSILSRYVRLE